MKCYIKKIIIKGFNAWQACIARFRAEVAYSLKEPCVRVCNYASSVAGPSRIRNKIWRKKKKKASTAPFPTRMAVSVPPPSTSVLSLINDVVCLIYDPPQQIRVSLFNLPLSHPSQKAQPYSAGNIRELLNKHSYVMSLPILSSS